MFLAEVPSDGLFVLHCTQHLMRRLYDHRSCLLTSFLNDFILSFNTYINFSSVNWYQYFSNNI